MLHTVLSFLAVFFSSFVLTSFLTRLIPRLKILQVEREEGPESHKVKSGTPTMGGIGFILTAAVSSVLLVDFRYLPVIFLFIGYSAIGLLDDSVKIIKGRNLGLTFWQKIILQTLFASLFVAYLILNGGYSNGVFWALFAVFIVVGCANAANLTDGLNGLLSGCGILAFASFLAIALRNDLYGGAAFSFVFILSLLGFIFFNFPRAKIFMGDTGSLGIGAALAGLAVILHREMALAVIGGVFLAEALSVIIQVVSYKLFRKRVFKMSPLHHHFELLGFSELQVVLMFWGAGMVLGILGALFL